jgi:hypothetical protein
MKEKLWSELRAIREAFVWKLEGLGEYDLRRPMTPTGTNLLGVMKHVAAEEYGYLGEIFGRPAPEQLACFKDGVGLGRRRHVGGSDESANGLLPPRLCTGMSTSCAS